MSRKRNLCIVLDGKKVRSITAMNGEKVRRRKAFLIHFFNTNCFYCGIPTQTSDVLISNLMTLDHIVPVSRGGNNDVSNLVICCASCNNDRGNKLFEDYMIKVLDGMSYDQRDLFYQRYDAREEFLTWYEAATYAELQQVRSNISDYTRQLARVS
jgi:hypothetical protein